MFGSAVVDVDGWPPDVITLGHLENNCLRHDVVHSSVVRRQEDGEPRGKDESAGNVLHHRPDGSSVKAQVVRRHDLNDAWLGC